MTAMDAAAEPDRELYIDSGLTAAQVAARISAGCTNSFEAGTSRTIARIVRANVFTRFNAIVGACFLLLLILGRWQDALFGLAALGNAVIGCIQELRAKATLDRLTVLNIPAARVRRGGVEQNVPPADLVIDDLLVLRAGDQIPADARLVAAHGLEVDESMLTGESRPIQKGADTEVLSGSLVVAGEGTARVSRVGEDAYANAFAAEARRFSLVSSELRTAIDKVLRWVGWGIGPVALLLLNAQLALLGGWATAWENGTWTEAAVDTIAAVTAMIPLGLVLMTSIAFAVGAARLARKEVLVNELSAVEVLARVDVICLDKTGTLTSGEIRLDTARVLRDVPGWRDVLAWFGDEPNANATARGLTEQFPVQANLTPACMVPFSSERKWAAVSFAHGPEGIWVLGAPDVIAAQEATDPRTQLGAVLPDLTAAAQRTLVLAYSPSTPASIDPGALPTPLELTAVLAFAERVRPDAAPTLGFFRAQGVAVRIISGDHPQTVAAIARKVGLETGPAVDGRTLPTDDVALSAIMDDHMVFGRVTPDQKLRMVTALQRRGHTVAMTGDGLNDALAVKNADLGIAMDSATAATKAVARVVLLDGRFSRLPSVLAEGRKVIANIERVSVLFLIKTAYATSLAILCGVLMIEFPFLPRQLSITDGVTIGIPAFFLALLPNARRYVPAFLARSLAFAVPAGIVIALALGAFAWTAAAQGLPEASTRTGATAILAVVGLGVVAAVSQPLNRVTAPLLCALFLALVGILALPLATEFFQLVPLGEAGALLVSLTIALTLGAIGAVWWSTRRRRTIGREPARDR